jgi:hypothetical protein
MDRRPSDRDIFWRVMAWGGAIVVFVVLYIDLGVTL